MQFVIEIVLITELIGIFSNNFFQDNVKFSYATIISNMAEFEEFAEALLGQLEVEINEEKEITGLSSRISEDQSFNIIFDKVEKISQEIFPELQKKTN